MEQFNLKEYLANPNRKVVTRDGRPVRIICTDMKDKQQVVALLQSGISEAESILSFYANGVFEIGRKSNLDLFFAPKKHKGWTLFVNSESIGPDILDSKIYATREEAQCMREADPGRYGAIVKLEWEE